MRFVNDTSAKTQKLGSEDNYTQGIYTIGIRIWKRERQILSL